MKKGDKKYTNVLHHCNMFAKNRKGQFYFMATIIIIGLMIGLIVIFNYSNKSNAYETQEIAKELSIESEKVMDYDAYNSETEFENFARDYSSYIGEDKKIYFIIVDEGDGIREAYRYEGSSKIDFSSNLNVGTGISFIIDEEEYTFDLKSGNNFYFIIIQETGGEKYVFSG